MNAENFNPCSWRWFVWLMQWAETGCWCCSSLRALLVGIVIGVLGMMVAQKAYGLALYSAAVSIPILIAILVVARIVWHESYAVDTEEPPK